jgi:hypothetical protein
VTLIGFGWGAYHTYAASAPEEPKEVVKPPAGEAAALIQPAKGKEKSDADAEDKTNLPKGHAPVQVLASLDNDGKLVVKTAIRTFRGIGSPGPSSDSAAPGVGGAEGVGGGPAPAKSVTTLRSQTYDLDDVQVLDTMGMKVDKKELAKLLKEEKVAMATYGSEPVDPLHLRVLKDGTLTFVLPGSKGGETNPDIAPAGANVPRPAQGPPADVLPPGALILHPMPGVPGINPDVLPGAIPPGPGALPATPPAAPQPPKP